MKIINERHIISVITEIFPIHNPVPVSKSLLCEGILSQSQLSELLAELERRYDINLSTKTNQRMDTINNIVEAINDAKGLSEYTVRSMFLEICHNHPDEDAIILGETRVTYQQLKTSVETMAAHLIKYGVVRESRTAIILSNSTNYIISYFALLYIGALPVPINTSMQKQQIFFLLDDSQCEYIICEERVGYIPYGSIVSEYAEEHNTIKNVFYSGKNLYGSKGVSFYDLSVNQINPDPDHFEKLRPESPAIITYTCATTDIPNGVLLSHNDIVKISYYTSTLLNNSENKEYPLIIAPLFSAQGFLSLLINFASESTFRVAASFSPNDILKEISIYKNTSIHSLPAIWALLLNCRTIEFARFNSIRYLMVSGSHFSPTLARFIEAKLNCVFINAYGLKEETIIVTMARPDDSADVRLNTVGRAIAGVEIKIVDDNRRELPEGQVGELAVRGYTMIGYHNRPNKSSMLIDADGWLYTGDLAKFYDNENIIIIGRRQDVIIRNGLNVYPGNIEDCILQMPQVQSVAVIGKRSRTPVDLPGNTSWDTPSDDIIAFIVPKAGAVLDRGTVISYLFNRLARYKIPDEFYFVSGMPVLPSGAINKNALLSWLENGIPEENQKLFGPFASISCTSITNSTF